MAVWSFQLTDLNFLPLGEVLNAPTRSVVLPLNKVPTASLVVRLDNPLAPIMASGLGYIKAYRNAALQFFGPIVTAEIDATREDATLAVNAAGVAWNLAHRLAGKTVAGISFASADRAVISKSLIDTANGEDETHIDTSLVSPAYQSSNGTSISANSATAYAASPFKPISECLLDLAGTLDGFDWRVTPLENYVNNAVISQKIGRFEAYPVMGIAQPEAVFEWGTGRNNVVSFKRTLSRDTQANKVYNYTSAGPDAPGAPTVVQTDATSITTWDLMEALAQADILDNTLRQRLVDEHVRVRKGPRQVVEFQPHLDDGRGRVPQYGTDFLVGDSLRGRICYNGSMILDAAVRCWGAQFDISSENQESITLTLSDDT